jgi:hypothetical protein
MQQVMPHVLEDCDKTIGAEVWLPGNQRRLRPGKVSSGEGWWGERADCGILGEGQVVSHFGRNPDMYNSHVSGNRSRR